MRHASILAYHVNYIFEYPFHVPNDKLRETICSQVARLLKEERERQKLSLNRLAQEAGLARQTVAFIEEEAQSPSFDTLLRITSALNVELEEIIAIARKHAKKTTTV